MRRMVVPMILFDSLTSLFLDWSTDGVRTLSTGDNETHCSTTHLTSFAVMLVGLTRSYTHEIIKSKLKCLQPD